MSLQSMSRPLSTRIPVVLAKCGPTVFDCAFIELFGVIPGTEIEPLLTQPENRRRRAALADSTRVWPPDDE